MGGTSAWREALTHFFSAFAWPARAGTGRIARAGDALRTPTGFHPVAPGCGVPAATRGQRTRIPPNPNGVASRLGRGCRGDGAGPPQGRNPFRVGASGGRGFPG